MFDAVRDRAAFMQIDSKVRTILIEALKEAADNSMCRAEGGHDTVAEIREELETYRQYEYVLRTLEEVNFPAPLTCDVSDVEDIVKTSIVDRGYCNVNINGAAWKVVK